MLQTPWTDRKDAYDIVIIGSGMAARLRLQGWHPRT